MNGIIIRNPSSHVLRITKRKDSPVVRNNPQMSWSPTNNPQETKQSVRVKETVFRIHEHCSNRLNKDTKECIAYWNAIDNFNNEIDYVYHTLKFKDNPLLDMSAWGSVEYDV